MAITKIQSESLNLADDFAFTGTITGAGGVNTPAFYAYMSSNQTGISDVTNTIIQFNSKSFDTNSAYDTSTYKFTVPTGEGGKYVIGVRIPAYFYSDKAWQIQIQLLINGSDRIEMGQIDEPSNTNSRYAGTATETTILTLSAGDYVQAEIYANTVSNGNFQVSASGGGARKGNFFWGYKLIGV